MFYKFRKSIKVKDIKTGEIKKINIDSIYCYTTEIENVKNPVLSFYISIVTNGKLEHFEIDQASYTKIAKCFGKDKSSRAQRISLNKKWMVK